MITNADQDLLQKKASARQSSTNSLHVLSKGFPYLKLAAAASVEHGILSPNADEEAAYLAAWQNYKADTNHRVVKFVPARCSQPYVQGYVRLCRCPPTMNPLPTSKNNSLHAFTMPHSFADLEAACQRIYAAGIDTLVQNGCYKDVVKAMLRADGLNYGALPKGLLKFHRYAETARTPLEEHRWKAHSMPASRTVGQRTLYRIARAPSTFRSPRAAGCARLRAALRREVSHQLLGTKRQAPIPLPLTPTIPPFRKADGSLLFRPGGHGALIENPNDIEADVVFVKNIDNVVPDRLKDDTVRYKNLLAGILVSLQHQAFAYLNKLDAGNCTADELNEMLHFLQHTLCIDNPQTPDLQGEALVAYLRTKLNRPMRVCGMVKNVGEPGGGPLRPTMPTVRCRCRFLKVRKSTWLTPKRKPCSRRVRTSIPLTWFAHSKITRAKPSTCLLTSTSKPALSRTRARTARNSRPWNFPVCGTVP